MKIVCLTEELVEFLFDIGRQDLIAGVSVYVERPVEAKSLPKVGAFTHVNVKKIVEMKPDLVVGFSDVQKEIARDLISEGLNVFITNQRSLDEIISNLRLFGRMIGESQKTDLYLKDFENKVSTLRNVNYEKRPRVYIEEWDEPTIIGIRWFTELVELCGGEVLFKERSLKSYKAMDRCVSHEEVVEANPDIVFVSWCGKKFDKESFINRQNFKNIKAVTKEKIFELDPAIFLQPGPALFKDGIGILLKLIKI